MKEVIERQTLKASRSQKEKFEKKIDVFKCWLLPVALTLLLYQCKLALASIWTFELLSVGIKSFTIKTRNDSMDLYF